MEMSCVAHGSLMAAHTLAGRVSQPTLEGAEDIILLLRLLRRPAAHLLVGGTAFPPVIGLGNFAPALQQGICDRGNPCNLRHLQLQSDQYL